jgi:outer membrane protein assembly factor BamD (BamD/ComL family)
MIRVISMKATVALCMLFIFLLTGCSVYNAVHDFLFKEKDIEPVEVLVQEGMDEFDSGNYKSALEYFQKSRTGIRSANMSPWQS